MKYLRLIWFISFLSLLLFSGCQVDTQETDLIPAEMPDDIAQIQQLIVGQMSGKYLLGDNTRMKSRWSREERLKAKDYLKELLFQLNIQPHENQYVSSNLNPAIDLILEPFRGANVYGILPSTAISNEYVVLGAHYDTGKRGAPGAIDNATGIALIYSVIKELSELERRTKNVVIVFFDQEEEELIGSKAFVNFLKNQDWNIHSVHCFDMVGWDGDGDRAMETFSASAELRELYREKALDHQIPLQEKVIDPVGYAVSSTDFDAFVPHGFNVIGAGECFYGRDSTPYKDSPQDTFETVDFSYLLSCTNFIKDIIRDLVL